MMINCASLRGDVVKNVGETYSKGCHTPGRVESCPPLGWLAKSFLLIVGFTALVQYFISKLSLVHVILPFGFAFFSFAFPLEH